jgi:hypothetical protein
MHGLDGLAILQPQNVANSPVPRHKFPLNLGISDAAFAGEQGAEFPVQIGQVAENLLTASVDTPEKLTTTVAGLAACHCKLLQLLATQAHKICPGSRKCHHSGPVSEC